MDTGLLELLYKYALVPLGAVFWWLYKKADSRLDRSEQANAVIQKEFELRMQTMEKALELRVQNVEKAVLVITTKFEVIQRDLTAIQTSQSKMFDKLNEMGKQQK